MKIIRHSETLFYYDGPQVFEARDTIGGHYIGVAVEPEGGDERYLVSGVAPERLQSFRLGLSDLRPLMLESGDGEWYLATAPQGFDEPLSLSQQEGRLADSELLPEEGFVLPRSKNVTWLLDPETNRVETPSLEIRGELQEADLEKGLWRLGTSEGAVFGTTVEGGTILKGLKLGSDYLFVCVIEMPTTRNYGGGVSSRGTDKAIGKGTRHFNWKKEAPIGGLRVVDTQLVEA